MDKVRYEKGGDAGSRGVGFQISLLTMFLLNALQRITNWRLSTENKLAGKFDDVVLEYPEGTLLLQAKHKKKKKITQEELLSTNSRNDDFSLAKYFLSYQEIKDEFKGKNTVIMCTNASVHEKTLEFLDSQKISPNSMLYYGDDDYSFYTVNKKILFDLKQSVAIYLERNYQNKTVEETVITEENLEDFLEHLQIYANYPSEHHLENVIEQLLSSMKHSNGLYESISPLEVRAKVMDWFQHKDGIYLTETRAKAMFSELRTDKYWQKLEQYNVFFRHNDLQFSDSKRIYHFVAENGYLLQVIKVYRALKNDKAKTLCVNPDDDVAVQKQIVEAFHLSKYSILVIVWPKTTEESIMTEISDIISSILKTFQYKKIVLVTECGDKLNQLFGLSQSDYEVSLGSGTFDGLSDKTRERLLNNKNIVFQGRDISLGELFTSRDSEDFEKAANLLLPRLVDDEKVTVGARLLDLNENVSYLYINRTFQRELGNIKNEEVKLYYSEEDIYDVNENIILIADTAGMGKTTVLTSLAAIIKEKHPLLWIIKIELNEFTAILKDFLKRNTETINVLDLLNSKDATRLTNELDNFVFTTSEKVVLMLDGVDEISPDYTDLIISLLVQCQKESNFAKIFVTTRPHLVHKLEVKLQVASFTLESFTEENQMYFLTRYWTHHLNLRGDSDKRKCEAYAKTLIHKMSLNDLNNGIEDHFAAIPLQLRMLAEIFQEGMVSTEVLEWEGCKEYLHVEEEEPKLPERMNLVKLYDMFIEKKRNIFIEKENPNGHTAATRALIDQFNDCITYHRSLALDIVLNEKSRDLFSCYRTSKDMELIALKIGIVQIKSSGFNIIYNDTFNFIHRTLAEYFVAESIIRELQCQNQNVKFQKFLIDEVFYTRRYNLVLTFFDNFLQNILDSIPPTVFHNFQTSSQHELFCLWKHDLIHRLAEHDCVAVLQLLLKCTKFKIIKDKETGIGDIYYADVRSNIKNDNTLNCVQFHLEQGGLNIKDYLDRTPLHFAASKGHLKMVKFLVEHGANINSISSYDNIPIVQAAQNAHVNTTRYLLEQALGLEQSVADETARVNDWDMAAFLLEINSGNNINKVVIPYVAACMGCLSALEASIERGIDVDSKFENGETLIFGAVRGKQLHIIEYLIDKGADINSKDNNGRTALHLISNVSKNVPTAKLLIELGIDIDVKDNLGQAALYLAVYHDNLDMMKLLVESGADINSQNISNDTPLNIAASRGNWDCVKFLKENGADVNVRDARGNTILHLATSHGKAHIMQFLVESGVDVSTRNCYGETILHAAASGFDENTIRYLVKLGLDVNATDDRGRTALYIAVEKLLFYFNMQVACEIEYTLKRSELQWTLSKFKCFLDHGADVNIKDNDGRAVLHLAAELGQLDTVILLIEAGADVNAKDKTGQTPLHLAANEGRRTVQFLIEQGANINCRDRKGRTAAALAKKAGHAHLLQYLKTVHERSRCARIWQRMIELIFQLLLNCIHG